ncbi:hypothetical protein [Sinorhizobium fredii]|uniref:hypothetical protein n=1 Tax=Rhizobium fredii TaxID=380 RepID=UPI0004B19DDC|nr:hypothetical protein [Sinorhizobium fredii]
MEKLLAFPDFQKALLFKFAVRAGADFETPITAAEAAQLVEGRFRQSWVKVAAEQLHEQEFLRPTSGFDDTYDTFYVLTLAGLNEAQQYARYEGFDLWAEIEKLEEQSEADTSANDFVPQGPVIEIDRSSKVFSDLEREIKDTLKHAQMSNQLMSDVTGQRRIKEGQAGQVLLESDRVDAGLIRRVFLPALRSLLKIASEEAIKTIIKKAIEALLAFLPPGA